jgi:two-component system, chemotaxis family, CheB/CheR fusion protein
LPEMLAATPVDEPIRAWSAGCATGQEACTIAMILCETLGEEAFKRRVKIYATDVDEEALNVARAATYTPDQVASVPDELRERYFERSDQRFTFRADVRRAVIFGRNNLVYDAPISRLDLLVCRNTLMYLTAETQSHILRHFHFALRDSGMLMLGRSEMMISHRELFAADDLTHRVFRKRTGPRSLQTRVADLATGDQIEYPASDEERQLREAAFAVSPHPQLVVSRAMMLSFANVAASALFGIGQEQVGQPLASLAVGGVPVALAGAVERAIAGRMSVDLGRVEYAPDMGERRWLDCTVLPLSSSRNAPLGALVVFADAGRTLELEHELETNRRDLEAAYEELQSTIDELETTNEELQSANEELQTTNEELQSTNEELETMNEELHSTNEELETINDELHDRTNQLNDVNDFLEAILASLGIGVAVLDRNQRVQIWNRGAEDLWGVRHDEASEQHFLALDIGLAPERLAPALRAVMGGASERETTRLEAVNRRGRPIVCDTTVIPLTVSGDGGGELRGAIVLMEERATEGAQPA